MATRRTCPDPDCAYDTVDPDLYALHRERQHGEKPPTPAPLPPRLAVGGQRLSTDPLERIEWQLDQIRKAGLVVAVWAVLSIVGAVLVAFAWVAESG